jgi:RNA polymerase sigma factor (sigma-70 family)
VTNATANTRNHYDSRHDLPAALRRDLMGEKCAPFTRDEERAAFARLDAVRAACWAHLHRNRLRVVEPEADQDDDALLGYLTDAHGRKNAATRSLLGDYRRAVAHVEQHNLRLVVSVARRYLAHAGARTFSLADLVGYGCTGLRTAVLRFEPARGFTFSTYATAWLKHAIGRAIQDLGRTIRLPIHLQDAIRKVQAAAARLGDPDASDAMLAAETGLPVESVRNARDCAASVAQTPVSLQRPAPDAWDDANPHTLGDILPDDGSTPDAAAEHAERYHPETLAALMAELRPIEVEVITRRAGLGGAEGDGGGNNVAAFDGGETLKAVGEAVGLCRERVRQIQEAALGKMRRSAQRRGLAVETAATA